MTNIQKPRRGKTRATNAVLTPPPAPIKGDLTLQILEAAGRLAVGAMEFAEAFLSVGYGASYGRMQRKLEEISAENALAAQRAAELQRVHAMVWKLKRDGLVATQQHKGIAVLRPTMRGLKKLAALLRRKRQALPPPTYEAVPSVKFTIVAFDIPECDRRKRRWLRDVLKNLDFAKLQKSLWIGKIKIPETLLKDLERLKLLGPVEIFEISKGGTLRQVA